MQEQFHIPVKKKPTLTVFYDVCSYVRKQEF